MALLGLIVVAALVALSQAAVTTKKCKATGQSSWQPLCTIQTVPGDTYALCSDKTVGGISGLYYTVDDSVTPLCYTYMFETTEASGFGVGKYLYRGINFDSSIKNCEQLCEFVRSIEADATEFKTLYVGCSNTEDGNSEDLTGWWRTGTTFTCKTNDNYGTVDKLGKPPAPTAPIVTVVVPVKAAPELLNYLVVVGVALVALSLMAFLPGVTVFYHWKNSQ